MTVEKPVRIVTVSELCSNSSQIADRVARHGERLWVLRRGKPMFALVSVEDLELLQRLEDRMDLELIAKAVKRDDFLPWAEVKKRLGL